MKGTQRSYQPRDHLPFQLASAGYRKGSPLQGNKEWGVKVWKKEKTNINKISYMATLWTYTLANTIISFKNFT